MKKEINTRYIDNLEKHIDTTKEAVKYSLERFDILIISLSSGGLVLSIGFVKDVIKDFKCVDPVFLKISWGLFALSLITNLLSQVTGYYANKFEIKISKNILRKQREKDEKGNQNRFLKLKGSYDFLTNFFNGLCLLSLIGAIVFLIIFINKYV